MSPFKKNFQRFLILLFSAISIVLVIMGITRSKTSPLSTLSGLGSTPPAPSGGVAPSQNSKIFTGKTYQTPWGNAVASITVTNGKITGVTMPQVPPSPPSQYAEPYLVDQALKAGGANIQGVSGATYTSIAFKSSLESAIALAGAQGQTIMPSNQTSSINISVPAVPSRYRDDDDD